MFYPYTSWYSSMWTLPPEVTTTSPYVQAAEPPVDGFTPAPQLLSTNDSSCLTANLPPPEKLQPLE